MTLTAPVLYATLVLAVAQPPRYHKHEDLSAWVEGLAVEYPRLCHVESIATSREGRAIHALRLAAPDGIEPDRRPALLVVANIDGDHLVGSEVAMEIAERCLADTRAGDPAATRLLASATVYIVPRVNPDAAERYFGEVRSDWRRNLRPDDRDRDFEFDEDPPDDVNGDGLVTMMRVPDPDRADRAADPDEPRLDVEPDRDAGERAAFTVMVEGADDDGDGVLNEDAVGGVDLNRNFMHGYPEHEDGAGPHPVSEPESLGLLRFVLAHPNIAIVVTYGRHDNLSSTPADEGTDAAGAPLGILPEDRGLYEHIGERFRALTGLESTSDEPAEGAFFAWAYAQFGVPSFATPVWRPPGEDEVAWLAYSDEEREGAGFVEFEPFVHPQLGAVEIGGWAPYFRTNPPPGEIAGIAAAHRAFLVDLAGRLPRVSLSEPQVRALSSGLYEVEAALINDGSLPTGTAMAERNRRARPHVVRLGVPHERVVAGQRVTRVWSIPGAGGRVPMRWLVRVDDDAPLTITVYSEKYGEFAVTVPLASGDDP